jgi:2-keto-4-pentenoate hydratase/2-oxohepta-3-ene-1,7-dioic acid hydratase in catechol pathway
MQSSRAVAVGVVLLSLLSGGPAQAQQKKVVKYARFEADGAVSYGIVEGDRVRAISGDLFGQWKPTDKTYELAKVKILAPTRPTQVFATAGNYRSHLPGEQIPEKFKTLQIFLKGPTCIIADGQNIVLPKDAEDVHYEGEMVIVLGKKCRNVSREQALEYVFGVTCGNDVSARQWQKNDVQWWRAKGSDTFGPCGPFIVSGLNYDDLQLTLRLNGEVRQQQRTKDLIHDVRGIVSGISKYMTLQPGDLIYSGTPGKTSSIKAGDIVEVEIEGVGILRNKVVAEK